MTQYISLTVDMVHKVHTHALFFRRHKIDTRESAT